MPATFAHPVFALWARRLGLPATALVTGAMAPDTGYLLLPYWSPWIGHTAIATVAFHLPVGLAMLFLLHAWIEPAAVDLLPQGWRDRIRRYEGTFRWAPWSRFTLIAFAVWFGAVTHVVVDGFTHRRGAFALMWPEVLIDGPMYFGLPLYRVLQFGGGVLGSLVLLASAAAWYSVQPIPVVSRPRELGVPWWALLAVVGVLSTGRALIKVRGTGFEWWHSLAMHGAVGGLVFSAIALLLLGGVFQFKRRLNRS